MNPTDREHFDRHVEWVLARLPQNVLNLLKEVPLHVEDQPSKRQMKDLGTDDPAGLCGYFFGIPFNAVSVFGHLHAAQAVPVPSSITIFRRGIIAASRNEQGKVRRSELRQQIRITILHELAHLLGMEEDELTAIGYG